ncbi:MAG TPA: branched-chain amino acid ABC transporter permease [Pseudolabrys sp.]|nr:branched-chain amino acid ABC transporter permease [Pseudolabrys sp.]
MAAIVAALIFGGNYALRLATIFAMYATLALSWNIIGGLAGYPSFATAAFFGLGTYTSAILQSSGVPILLAWALGGLSAAAFAAIIGLAILHLKGHYFAIASLALVEVLRELVNINDRLTGGGMGLNLPVTQGSVTQQAAYFLAAMLALATVTLLMTAAVYRGRLGFALRCIQQNEDAAVMLGVNARLYKAAAFTLSAVFPGVAGGIYASWVHYIDPSDVFDILLSVKPLVMVLVGGLGTLFGPVVGAAVFLALEEAVWRSFLTVHAAVLGALVVALILFLPNGLMSINRRRLGARET